MDPSSAAANSLIRRLWGWARRHWVITTVGLAAAVGLGIWLIFFYFAVQTLFIDEEVDEALPTFGAPAAPAEAPAAPPAAEAPAPAPEPAAAVPAGTSAAPAAPTPAPAEGSAPAPAPPAAEAPAPAGETAAEVPGPSPAELAPPAPVEGPMVAGPGASGMPGDEITAERADAMNEAMASGAMPLEVVMNEERPMPVAPQIVTLASGEFSSRSHQTSGRALVLNDGSEQRFLRFENFRTDNGPDVNIYLSSAPFDAPARDFALDFVDLGDMKGNVGAQNYEIPPGVELDRYATVVVWCVRFSVAFGVAPLA
ncbi:MAG: DM13 domain-containing protein [bacterium]|nr:DM13 domain-containing protein [bacterium]